MKKTQEPNSPIITEDMLNKSTSFGSLDLGLLSKIEEEYHSKLKLLAQNSNLEIELFKYKASDIQEISK